MTDGNYRSILELLETRAKEMGGRTACTDPKGSVSYAELQERAAQAGGRIAAVLEKTDQRRNQDKVPPIAVYTEKQNALLVMLYAVQYAGCFYVVLNPEQPQERIDQILSILQPAAVIAEDALMDKARTFQYKGPVVSFSALLEEQGGSDAKLPGQKRLDGDAPLYGIFTSGSTGTPKCVLISHRNVLDFIGHFTEAFHFDPTDIIGNQAPFDFDVSVKDIYSALYVGAELVLIPREYFSQPARLLDYLIDHRVTSLTWAVSAVCLISAMKGFAYKVPTRIRRVMFSGEVMPIKQLRIWQKHLPEAEFVNLYGPTEITCNCMYFRIPNPYLSEAPLPLNAVFDGREVTIRDKQGKILTKPGSVGEITVSGESLARCYYHNPEQTRAHFAEMKDSKGQMVRAYKTGDLAQILPDGAIRFAGRQDFQIKHMGHRIELEEIEKDVMALSGVSRCICSFDDRKKRIAAYYTGSLDKRSLHLKLKAKLPVYMVPNRFCHVENFPLNKNGKIDRKALNGLLQVE
jgi:D-alanine--poly(phosphoribitol) ligase subunit 1